MAVEKMELMTVAGPRDNIEEVLRSVVLLEKIHIESSLKKVGEGGLTLCMLEEAEGEMECEIRPYAEFEDFGELEKKMAIIKGYFGIEFHADKNLITSECSYKRCSQELEWLYSKIEPIHNEIVDKEGRLTALREFKDSLRYISSIDVTIEELEQMKYFSFRIGTLSKDKRLKLKESYDSITAAIFHIGSSEKEEVYLAVYPQEIEEDTDKVLKSLNFHDIQIPQEITGNPGQAIAVIDETMGNLEAETVKLKSELEGLREEYEEELIKAYNMLLVQKQIERIKRKMAVTDNFFFLTGWVPRKDKEQVLESLEKSDERVAVVWSRDNRAQALMRPPTKLSNNWLIRPFENLVKMYGVPSYDELDPTTFLGITYMLLFGAMFGDVGQGAVLFLAGLYLALKVEKLKSYGSILTRIGGSSIVFGFMYGSIFGFEHVLPALFVRPIENINFVLASSVVLGVVLLTISFMYNIVNAVKQRNMKDGLFGRNGVAGLIFYAVLLIMIYQVFASADILNVTAGAAMAIVLIALMVLREPLSNIIMKKRPLYHESPSQYYIESGFDIFETLMSMASNTISFIRVGAFALNHAGLFMAFLTMASLMGNPAGSALMIVLGNLIIIGLEGLIVFIQGLRLEYYELFSKYFKGEGREFDPVKMSPE